MCNCTSGNPEMIRREDSGFAPVPGIANWHGCLSFETATEPVIGRAFARPVGGLLGMRSNLLKHNNLMLRSERRERLEAWAASDSPFSHSQCWRAPRNDDN